MCGIGGCIVAPGARPPRAGLERMAAAMSHRGPDDEGIVIAGNVGLVNTRLAIVDPSPTGHQPIGDPSGRWLLTYNGEIFNHAEIRELLPRDGWRGNSDTETLVTALAQWHEDVLRRCNGFFAFAALDVADRRLFLARDRFGVKPLYVGRRPGSIWFASEIRALTAAGIPARARRDVLAHAAAVGGPAGRMTPIEAIERVPPGGLISIDTETLLTDQRRWHEPADAVGEEVAGDLAGRNRGALADHLEATLRDAVRRRLLGDVPIGTACSGGLDSTLVTALARDEDRSIVAFNASLVDEGAADEGRWAQIAANGLDVDLETVRVTVSDWRRGLVDAVAHHEYPLSAAGSSVPLSLLARRARERGFKVLLTGEAADELFGGYTHIYGAEFRHFLPARAAFRRIVEELRGRRGLSPVRRRGIARIRGNRPGAAAVIDPPLELVDWQHATRRSADAAYEHHPGARGRLESVLLSGLSSCAFSFLLNRMDKDLMAHSVETRFPFLDSHVVELAVNLPLEHRVAPATKGLLRDVAHRWIPGPIARRPKQHGMVFRAGQRIEEAARPSFLEAGCLRELLQLPADRWRRLIDRARDGATMWSAEIWCRLFIEGQDVAAVERELWVPERI
jgi:asparagine synthase (glutamine-hydrolysing)